MAESRACRKEKAAGGELSEKGVQVGEKICPCARQAGFEENFAVAIGLAERKTEANCAGFCARLCRILYNSVEKWESN